MKVVKKEKVRKLSTVHIFFSKMKTRCYKYGESSIFSPSLFLLYKIQALLISTRRLGGEARGERRWKKKEQCSHFSSNFWESGIIFKKSHVRASLFCSRANSACLEFPRFYVVVVYKFQVHDKRQINNK